MTDVKPPDFTFQKVCDIAYEEALNGLTQSGLQGMKAGIRLSMSLAYRMAIDEHKYQQSVNKEIK